MDTPPNNTPKHFRRLAMIVAGGVGVLVLVVGVTMLSLYRQAKATPPGYAEAIAVPAERIEEDRREFESQLTALYSDTQSLDEWRSTLTAGQINAWLATRLPVDFPRIARAGFTDPRVMIDEDALTLAVRGAVGKIHGVLTIALRPFVTAEGEVALEIDSAKIGRLTLPLDQVMAKLRRSLLDRIAPVRWSQTESRALLLVDLRRVAGARERELRLTGVDLREGELLIRGESESIANVDDAGEDIE